MPISAQVRERPRRLALRGARLFDGADRWDVADPTVLIDGATITGLLGGGAGDVPEDADLVDLPGTTLLPGLIDTHVHLCFDASADPVATLAERDDEAALAAMVTAGRTALAGGVTTVRDLGDRDYLSLQLRGRADLPTILCAGPPITTVRGHCHFLGGQTADGVDAVRAAVRERVERGCDVIKVMASGGTMTPGTRQEDPQFDREALQGAVREAHLHGLSLTAHAHATSAVANCIAAGVDGMEHVSFWTADGIDAPEELLQAIADRRIVVGMTAGMLPPPPGFAPPPAIVARMPMVFATLRRLVELDAVMVFGTDAGIAPIKPHDVVRQAHVQAGEIGIDPVRSLRMMTSVAAGVVGLGERKGRLAPGFDADLLVVDGDPLTDPPALHQVRAVYARGVRVTHG